MNGLHPCTLPQRAPFAAVRRVSPLCAAFCPDCECVRSSGAKASVVTEKIPFADLILDTESRSVSRQGEMIPLTYTEFQILELLVTHKKKIYSLENIYQSIWGEDAVGDSAIMVQIKNIRKKLGDDSRNPKYIKTAWGRGYYVDQ